MFDAYREQETHRIRYKSGADISGLENVLYQCPHCGREFSIEAADANTLRCNVCGFTQAGDELAFLHNTGNIGKEIRYVSDWSRAIYADLKKRIESGIDCTLTASTKIHMIDHKKHKFAEVGQGTVTLTADAILIQGQIHGAAISLSVPIGGIPTLPFSPGKHFEVQHGKDIYRCVLDDGKLVMKYINMVKIFFAIKYAASVKTRNAVAP